MRLTCGGRELVDGESAGSIPGVVLCLLYDSRLAGRSSKCACEEPAPSDLDTLSPDWVRRAVWQHCSAVYHVGGLGALCAVAAACAAHPATPL